MKVLLAWSILMVFAASALVGGYWLLYKVFDDSHIAPISAIILGSCILALRWAVKVLANEDVKEEEGRKNKPHDKT